MNRYLYTVLFILTVALGCLCGTNGHDVNPQQQKEDGQTQISPFCENHAEGETAALFESQSHKNSEALIEDPQSNSHYGYTRTPRILPSSGCQPGKMEVKYRSNYYEHSAGLQLNDQSFGTNSIPFQSAVSRTYYVIALRHILC